MSMTCKICRHNDRKGIERALVRGDSLRDIARRHKTSKDAVQRHRGCFAEMYDRDVLAAKTVRVVNLRSELERAIADIKRIRDAALDVLENPRQPGHLNLSRRGAFDAAKLLLQSSDKLDRHLRMLGDLTGEFKQPQVNPRNVDRRMYEEFVTCFERLCKTVNPDIYLLCGLAATFAQLAFSSGSNIPNLGVSGAIAGVLGAYILLFPRSRVNVLMGRGVIPMPALAVIGIWIILQFVSGIGSISNAAETGGVAYMAHIGGFIAGFVLTFFLRGKGEAAAT